MALIHGMPVCAVSIFFFYVCWCPCKFPSILNYFPVFDCAPTTPIGCRAEFCLLVTWPTQIWSPYYPGRVGCDSFGSEKAEPRAKIRGHRLPCPLGHYTSEGPSERPAPPCYVLYCNMQQRFLAPTWENLRTWYLPSSTVTFIMKL